MARYTGPVCRLCRREGEKLYLKGDRCYTDKCAIVRRAYAPGQHGQNRPKSSGYGMQLREKQKVRRIYGILERQFRNYFELAEKQAGITGENFLKILETRLDNVVYRLGFATSRNEARQLVLHGHVVVNGRRVNIPSYLVSVGSDVSIKENSKNTNRMKEIKELNENYKAPSWLEVNIADLSGKIISEPKREEIDIPVQEHLIVEFYSR